MSSPSVIRVEVLSPTLVEVTTSSSDLGVLTNYLSDHGLLSMRQPDCVVVEGCWRTILNVLARFDGDPWLGEATIQDEEYAAVA